MSARWQPSEPKTEPNRWQWVNRERWQRRVRGIICQMAKVREVAMPATVRKGRKPGYWQAFVSPTGNVRWCAQAASTTVSAKYACCRGRERRSPVVAHPRLKWLVEDTYTPVYSGERSRLGWGSLVEVGGSIVTPAELRLGAGSVVRPPRHGEKYTSGWRCCSCR